MSLTLPHLLNTGKSPVANNPSSFLTWGRSLRMADRVRILRAMFLPASDLLVKCIRIAWPRKASVATW